MKILPRFPLLKYFISLGRKEEELDSDDLDDDDFEDEDEEDEEKEEDSSDQICGAETLDSLKRYMDQMDQELLSTNVGQSFTQMVNPSSLLLPCIVYIPCAFPSFNIRLYKNTLLNGRISIFMISSEPQACHGQWLLSFISNR